MISQGNYKIELCRQLIFEDVNDMISQGNYKNLLIVLTEH